MTATTDQLDHADHPTTSSNVAPVPPTARRRGRRPERVALVEPPTGRGFAKLVIVLGLLTAIGPLTIDTYLPALPSITSELGATQAQVQGTLTGILLGMGLGQLVVGPLADAIGRRKPLVAGLALHIVASIACAFAPTIELLTAGRVVQGLGNAAVAVVAMAIVRDLYAGAAAATILSRLMLVMGMAPILAPSLGGAILQLTTWRGVFVIVAVGGVLLLVMGSLALPETLPPTRRIALKPAVIARTYGTLLRDRQFMGLVMVAGFAFATLFGYVGGSSFVLQDVFGLSVAQFAVAFGVNSMGLLIGSQINPYVVRRFGQPQVLKTGVTLATIAALLMLASATTEVGGLLGILVPLWFILLGMGLTLPNIPALALANHGRSAGTAAALLGASQFAIGGITAPLIGTIGSGSAIPMAVVMASTVTISAVFCWVTLSGRAKPVTVDVDPATEGASA